MRFRSPQAWVEAFLGAAPIPGVSTLDVGVRRRIVDDAVDGLRAYVASDGLRFPLEANIATARR